MEGVKCGGATKTHRVAGLKAEILCVQEHRVLKKEKLKIAGYEVMSFKAATSTTKLGRASGGGTALLLSKISNLQYQDLSPETKFATARLYLSQQQKVGSFLVAAAYDPPLSGSSSLPKILDALEEAGAKAEELLLIGADINGDTAGYDVDTALEDYIELNDPSIPTFPRTGNCPDKILCRIGSEAEHWIFKEDGDNANIECLEDDMSTHCGFPAALVQTQIEGTAHYD